MVYAQRARPALGLSRQLHHNFCTRDVELANVGREPIDHVANDQRGSGEGREWQPRPGDLLCRRIRF